MQVCADPLLHHLNQKDGDIAQVSSFWNLLALLWSEWRLKATPVNNWAGLNSRMNVSIVGAAQITICLYFDLKAFLRYLPTEFYQINERYNCSVHSLTRGQGKPNMEYTKSPISSPRVPPSYKHGQRLEFLHFLSVYMGYIQSSCYFQLWVQHAVMILKVMNHVID